MEYDYRTALKYCSYSNTLNTKVRGIEKQIKLVNVTNVRLVKKQRSSLIIFFLLLLYFLFNLVVISIYIKFVIALLILFLFIARSKTALKLLINFHGNAFCEIPLKKKDLEIVNELLKTLSTNG
ncbi:hypothetical protein SAMN05444396_104279 [Flavobacterium segetis]|uniref:Uncharacterized protein n=1 Tax=Flavobacterium segetis TaxID=271157 RepID=A0A1M5H096_9FLAO|nr:hypothetical protein SAMN05444396_104279 [Flavobacterium segetis]